MVLQTAFVMNFLSSPSCPPCTRDGSQNSLPRHVHERSEHRFQCNAVYLFDLMATFRETSSRRAHAPQTPTALDMPADSYIWQRFVTDAGRTRDVALDLEHLHNWPRFLTTPTASVVCALACPPPSLLWTPAELFQLFPFVPAFTLHWPTATGMSEEAARRNFSALADALPHVHELGVAVWTKSDDFLSLFNTVLSSWVTCVSNSVYSRTASVGFEGDSPITMVLQTGLVLNIF
jgi:hypothetical protein